MKNSMPKSFKGWEKVKIQINNGEIKDGIAPVIISASRRTDIPAFYSKWIINRFKDGYVKWINPFNGQPQYVSFKNTRIIVFWSKNPRPLLPYLQYFDEKGINYYFQFTLNNYDEDGFEPNVPPLEQRIATFKELSNMIGKERVIWRFDPLILTDKINIERLLDKVHKVGTELYKYTCKLVISFADIEVYAKVKRNLTNADIKYIEFDKNSMAKIAQGLQKLNKDWQLEIATCSEEINFKDYNIMPNKCIDDDLMIKLFMQDNKLMEFLGIAKNVDKNIYFKDKGQRKVCGCIVSKDIGQYNTCPHQCIYCYANASPTIAQKNYYESQVADVYNSIDKSK